MSPILWKTIYIIATLIFLPVYTGMIAGFIYFGKIFVAWWLLKETQDSKGRKKNNNGQTEEER